VEERVRNAPDAVRFEEVPIRYAAGRWEEGRLALETYLRAALGKRHVTAYELLFSIYNEDSPEPTNRCRVTLWHFYSKLGRRLDEWEGWRTWVLWLHAGLLRVANVRRAELLANAGLLPGFYERLMRERERRSRGSGVTFGQPDLVDSERKVRKRHEALHLRHERWATRPNPLRDEINTKMRTYFPLVLGDR
jgi:hypothetical protein